MSCSISPWESGGRHLVIRFVSGGALSLSWTVQRLELEQSVESELRFLETHSLFVSKTVNFIDVYLNSFIWLKMCQHISYHADWVDENLIPTMLTQTWQYWWFWSVPKGHGSAGAWSDFPGRDCVLLLPYLCLAELQFYLFCFHQQLPENSQIYHLLLVLLSSLKLSLPKICLWKIRLC